MYRRFQGDFFGWGGYLRGEDFSTEELLMGEDIFNGGGTGLSSIIKKNNEKINMKSFLSTESKKQH